MKDLDHYGQHRRGLFETLDKVGTLASVKLDM